MTKKMKPKVKKLWVQALLSGEYKQGRSRLRDDKNRFCCLGVLCNLHAQTHPRFAKRQTNTVRYDRAIGIPSERVLKWAGLDPYDTVVIDGVRDELAGHNDGFGRRPPRDFKQIAKAIEEQL